MNTQYRKWILLSLAALIVATVKSKDEKSFVSLAPSFFPPATMVGPDDKPISPSPKEPSKKEEKINDSVIVPPPLILPSQALADISLNAAKEGQKAQSSEKKEGAIPSLPVKDGVAEKEASQVLSKGDKVPQEEATIYLNFENTSLKTVLDSFKDMLKLNIIPNKDMENVKISSFICHKPYTLSSAFDVLVSLMQDYGFILLKKESEEKGVYYEVIPNKEKPANLAYYSTVKGDTPDKLPNTAQIIRYAYYFSNIKADTAFEILKGMVGPTAVEINRALNACIIVARADVAKPALEVIRSLDEGGVSQHIQIVMLSHSDPTQIAQLFDSINQGGSKEQGIRLITPADNKEASYFSHDVRIIPDTVKKALIVMGKKQDMQRVVDFIKILDKRGVEEEVTSRISIVEVKYYPADKLKALVQSTLQAAQTDQGRGTATGYVNFDDVVLESETPPAPGAATDVTFPVGNRILIACSDLATRKAIEQLIASLDVPLPQVGLEMLVVEANERMLKELSSQMRSPKVGQLGPHIEWQSAQVNNVLFQNTNGNNSLLGNMIGAVGDKENASYISFGKTGGTNGADNNVWGLIKALANKTGSNVLNQPFMVISNRQECVFSNVEKRELQGGEIYGTAGTRGVTKVASEAVNTTLQITPYINSGGYMTLYLNLTFEDFEPEIGGQPAKAQKSAKTVLYLGEGEVGCIGGLTFNKQTDVHYRPAWSRIPLIGNFCKGKSADIDRRHLYFFIRPSVIKPSFEGSPDAYTQLKLDYAKYKILDVKSDSATKDPIQRWFFKSSGRDNELQDIRTGRYRPIDDYAQNKHSPVTVNIGSDPYYRSGQGPSVISSKKAEISFKEEDPARIVFDDGRENARKIAPLPSRKDVKEAGNS